VRPSTGIGTDRRRGDRTRRGSVGWTAVPVRPAEPADLDAIAALIRELAAYEHMSDDVVWELDDLRRELFGPDPAAQVLLAESDDGSVAGMALWFPTFSTFLGRRGIWLEDLFVRAEHRRRGHGRALLAHLRGLTDGRVEWDVLDWNTSAQAFYDELGARPVPGWVRYRWLPEGSR
jgi:GNAT superfamily N-acetyltransferase